MRIEDFILSFGGRLSATNRWIKMEELMPWEMIEEIYAKNFKSEKPDGRPPLSARIAFGSLHIQASECFTDEKTPENICENPYLQYFLGLHAFETQPLFDASMMTLFRKRFTMEDIAKISEELYRRTHPPKDTPPKDGGNDGTLVPDATAASLIWTSCLLNSRKIHCQNAGKIGSMSFVRWHNNSRNMR